MNSKTVPKALLRLLPFLAIFILFCNDISAQKININFKDTPLKNILTEVNRQTGYDFVYSNALTAINDKVTISYSANGEPVEKLFDALFIERGISYKINNKQVTLAPKEIVPGSRLNRVASSGTVSQEVFQIKGKVLDDTKLPLPGVSIQNLTSKKGSFSDNNGDYTLEAKNGDRIRFSSIGMITKEVVISGSVTVYNIEMSPDNILLQDVVVTGYQTLSKERATGSFNIIKAEQLEKPATNLGQRIIGTSAGVQTKTDVNGNVTFEIRGQTSLLAAAQPLIVVDGFAIQGDLRTINPNDVESITILKDAAATSIWGARSANGVIVITSKSGLGSKRSGVKVDFSSFLKYAPKTDINYQNPFATSTEIIDYEQRGFSTTFFGGPWVPLPNSNTSLTGTYSAAVQAMNEARMGYITATELNATLDRLRKIDNRQDIKDHMLQNPFTQQYNLNISGSNERMTNVLSLMYEGSNQSYTGDNAKKYIANYRANVKVFRWLDFFFSGSFGMTDERNNGAIYTSSPYHALFNEDGSYASVPFGVYMPNMLRHVPMSSFPYSDWSYNPIREVDGRDFRTKQLRARAQAGLTFKVIDGLTIDSKIQYEMINNDTKNIYNEDTYTVRSTVNFASTWDKPTGKVTTNLPKGGFLDQSRNNTTAYNWRNQINYNKLFAEKHQISVIAGAEVSDRVYQTFGNPRTYGYDNEKLTVGTFPNGVGGSGVYALKNWTGGAQTFAYTNSYSYSTDRYFSMYGNASYTFDSKYTLSGSARTDASNLITDDPKYRYAPFWSVGASWAITKEEFMKSISWLDRLLIRATYGYNGNVDKSTSFMPLITVTGTQNIYIQDYTASIGSYGNPTLRWEKTGTINLGFDFDMFKGKLYGKLDVYNKKGKDLIVAMSIPAVNGTASQKLNMAEMTNRGIELELGTLMKLKDNDIVWVGNLNFSYNKNKIDNLFKATYAAYDLYGGGTAAYVQGYDANTLWSFKYAGVVDKGVAGSPNWQPVVQGKGEDLYDFTGWTPGDGRDYMLNMGTKVAPFAMGFSSTFKVYDFDISFIVTGKFGHVFNGFSFNYPSMSGGSALPNKLYNEILDSDPMVRVPIPFGKAEPRYYFWDRFYPYLDYLVQNANHIRMQELNITYNMPKFLTSKLGISSAKLYAQANNLFTLSNNKYNEDPEFPLGSLRPQASFTFGLNLGF
ncbi:MAG: SusC/RagA family TonB-linked outer membrane protein [Bacteroidetes bacterium HGW-Bacteroidetes-8]|jgi:TonB-linked SusC/RagA family outer membrane protein|nr:MAG: SusC/RagA family TonB-linked outer membrane protein [Bacteroidetes bacterium HGW-Bacteroidetes-8]